MNRFRRLWPLILSASFALAAVAAILWLLYNAINNIHP